MPFKGGVWVTAFSTLRLFLRSSGEFLSLPGWGAHIFLPFVLSRSEVDEQVHDSNAPGAVYFLRVNALNQVPLRWRRWDFLAADPGLSTLLRPVRLAPRQRVWWVSDSAAGGLRPFPGTPAQPVLALGPSTPRALDAHKLKHPVIYYWHN